MLDCLSRGRDGVAETFDLRAEFESFFECEFCRVELCLELRKQRLDF